ncbi:hypothetical protein FQR65_LT11722 [Abscondita terminalis]|nr:hypothetical protein FQR65_LT11722 [Abscondita terminalis]
MYALYLLSAILFFYGYIKYTKRFSYWEKRGVAHPNFSLLFGNLSETIFLKKSLGQVYHDIYKAYPDHPYVGFYKLRQHAILIRDPELVQKVLISDFNYFNENDFDIDKENDYIILKNPLLARGEDWKSNRGRMVPFLTNNKIKSIFPIIKKLCQNFVEHLDNPIFTNGENNVKELCEKYTMDVAILCALGLEGNSFKSENTECITNIKKIISPGSAMSLKVSILMLLPTLAKFLKIKFVPDEVIRYFKMMFKRTLHYRMENNIQRNDFFQDMYQFQQKFGEDIMSDIDIIGHSFRFFIDGYETNSNVLSHVLYDLGTNVSLQEHLREEIVKTLKNGNEDLTFELLDKMTYLNKFIYESLRLHSPALFFSKRCTKTYKLPPISTNSKEVLIETGTPVVIPVHSLHYDSKYFPNPKKFDPERFSSNNVLTKATFLAFGDGPRKCIGQNLGLAQIKVAIIYLVLHYDIRVNPKTKTPLEIDPTYFLLSPKGGIWLNFIKRNKHL